MTPLAGMVRDWAVARADAGAHVLFISGAQGVGKSTACAAVTAAMPGVCVIGLDDFYLGRSERARLASAMHPLCATRGPPGTHDVALLATTITRLRTLAAGDSISIRVFDKATDDRAPRDRWRTITAAPSLIIVEGWMMGVAPDLGSLRQPPLNAIEAQDANGLWRAWQEAHLTGGYARLWDMADAFLHIDAPSFDCIARWRMQQEETTLGLVPGALPAERRDWVRHFILHYERLTRRMLSGGRRAGWAIPVDATRMPGALVSP